MSTLAEIEAAIVTLKQDERERLENFLRELRSQHTTGPGIAETARENGFDPFPRRTGAPVTNEQVRQIREKEGI